VKTSKIDKDLIKTFSSKLEWDIYRKQEVEHNEIQERMKKFKETAKVSINGLNSKEQDHFCEFVNKWVKVWYSSSEISKIADREFTYSDASKCNRFFLAKENFRKLFYDFFKHKLCRYESTAYNNEDDEFAFSNIDSKKIFKFDDITKMHSIFLID
jgi:hypothetical protein